MLELESDDEFGLLDDDDLADDADIPVSYHNALILNEVTFLNTSYKAEQLSQFREACKNCSTELFFFFFRA
jgi:hypothetical protein